MIDYLLSHFEFLFDNILLSLLFLNIVTCLFLILYPSLHNRFLIGFSFFSSILQSIFAFIIWFGFDNDVSEKAQYGYYLYFNAIASFLPAFRFGIDGLGLHFFLISVILLPLCLIISSLNPNLRSNFFHAIIHFATFLSVLVFTSQDLLCFYVFYESILIPIFVLIIKWGSRERKVHAAYMLFFYTFLSSLCMLITIYYIYTVTGSTDINIIMQHSDFGSYSHFLWFSIFFAFGVKVPIVPFHVWLPEAHAEAPTVGSVYLAGIVLKMGGYGMLKFLLPIFPEETTYFRNIGFVIAVISIVYSAFATTRQIDLKKLIAYSSVCHMNYATLGIMSGNFIGIQGAIFLMIGHAFVSSALFICVGALYDRFHSRSLLYYGGLSLQVRVFSMFFLLFTIASVSFPGTSNFVGELSCLLGSFDVSPLACAIATLSLIISGVYSFWLFSRLIYGFPSKNIKKYSDLDWREILVLTILLLFIMLLGFFPSIVTDSNLVWITSVLKL